MRTVALSILAESDEEWVIALLNGLAQKQIIALVDDQDYPTEGSQLSPADLQHRLDKAENSRTVSYEELTALKPNMLSN
ncbi:hypothetical protein [Arsenicibacter rosenii]|uniref:Uncharacterized protein n=1 Tax=Arsenicibacter rosenii TaxID=1750698 RepID=A0A1S2VDB7_9BACT|nr:hypothetical protein [Arsenicibacter rosenii]OIN56285.1 hypothetical protein BLX24_25580 [Arsenicibacter rosenii]